MFARLFGGTYHPSRPTASSHGPGTHAYMTPLNLFSRRQWLLGVTATLASTVVARPRVAAETNLKGPRVQHQSFGQVSPQQSAHVWTVTNSHGLVMRVTDYGARLVALEAPDRTGKLANVNLGFDRAEDYVKHTAYFGCTTGRFANRISKGRFQLDGREFRLATNNGAEHLHGGTRGFDRQLWQAEEVSRAGGAGVRFRYTSPDGEEGYPGELTTVVTYWLTDDNELRMEYEATTKGATVLNLTNHAYWNLTGAKSGKSVLGHVLTLDSDAFLEVGDGMIPTGRQTKTAGSFMDFATPHAIGSRIEESYRAFAPPGGYDHCYVLRKPKAGELTRAARVEEPDSGRVMEVWTTEPAVQFYSANFLNGAAENGGHEKHGAFCLETQHFPDSPNHPEFPTTVLRPGETYRQTTVHRFSVLK